MNSDFDLAAVLINPQNHVTKPTSPRAPAGSSIMASRSIPSQKVRALQCAGGYSKGPGGCEFCMCAPTLNFGHTTWGSVLVDPPSAVKPKTVKPQTAFTLKPSAAKPVPVSVSSSAQPAATQITTHTHWVLPDSTVT